MRPRVAASFLLAALLSCARAPARPDRGGANLSDVEPHPRLYANREDWASLRSRLTDPAEKDSELVKRYAKLESIAERTMLPGFDGGSKLPPPLDYRFTSDDAAPTIRPQAKLALRRISTLAGLLRLEIDPASSKADVRGNPKFKQALSDLMAVSGPAFPNWNPKEFLDTAEMIHAVALGYDWLYDWLTPEERKTIRMALVEKGLEPGLRDERAGAPWTRYRNNWAQVTRGGLAIGALAVLEDSPGVAKPILLEAERELADTAINYSPDGGWPEGLNYWNYATSYFAAYLACIRSATGRDSPLVRAPGMAETGLFEVYDVGPIQDPERLGIQDFDFADDPGSDSGNAHMFWLGRRYGRPEFFDKERRRLAARPWTSTIFHLLWDPGRSTAPTLESLPLDHEFRGIQTALFRSSWTDPEALFIGFKGGVGGISHGHLDQGSFVIDAFGRRWAADLGPDSYALPGYFSRDVRWTYYRTSTAGHNTVTVDGKNQEFHADSPMIAFSSAAARRFAVADLHAAYANQLAEFRRGIALHGDRILIQDELAGVAGSRSRGIWHFHTPAEVSIHGGRALLTEDGRRLELSILAPSGAVFAAAHAGADSPPGQNPNAGITDITFEFPLSGTRTTLAVDVGTPDGTAAGPRPLIPLDRWDSTSR